MRKKLAAAFEILLDETTGQSGGIDFEEHEALRAPVESVGRPDHLRSVGAVDESFTRETVRPVFARRVRGFPFDARCDVKEAHEAQSSRLGDRGSS
jgi:hypothetical protein